MSKAGAPIVKKKRPFVATPDVIVYVLENERKQITGFKATIDGKDYFVVVKGNILAAWQKLEALLDKHTAKELLRKKR